jgi:hypothetical protein
MQAIIFTSVQALSTTATAISTANLGGATISANGGFTVYVWSDAIFRVTGPNSSTSQARFVASKWHCIGNPPNAARLTFASESATPDMRIMITDGLFHGV